MNRYCFQLQVAPEHLDEYRLRHAEVWPDMLAALHDTGWRNYSLFLRGDGMLIGYLESELTFDELQAGMAVTEVNARWQADMARLFTATSGTADTNLVLLPEVFNLEAQLGAGEVPTRAE